MNSAPPTWLLMEAGGPTAALPHRARIAGVGRCLPETVLTTAELMASTRHRTGIDLERLTGIRERRVSRGEHDSLSLAAAAATDCLRTSGTDPGDVDLVISCSITKYRGGLVQWLEPSTSQAVAAGIGAHRARTFDVSNACAGMLTGAFIANNRIRRGVAERVLIVSGEYISQLGTNAARHVRNVMSQEMASLTLGDAGAALLLERTAPDHEGIDVVGFTTVAEYSRLCLAYPADHDPGARMFTRSRALQKAAIRDTPQLLGEALDAAGMKIGDVDHVIPHQTSSRAIRTGMAEVCAALGGEPAHPAVATVERYGNTASTTHTVALVEEIEGGRIRPGERVALIALASGIVIGVVLFTADRELVASRGDGR